MSVRWLELDGCRIDLAHQRAFRGGLEHPLTTLETRLLAFLAERGQASREEILARVWEANPAVRTRAVESTVRRLRGKIEADPADPRLLLSVHGTGYRLVQVPPSALVGREALRSELYEAILTDRSVVLLGPGGVGKTALARSVLGPGDLEVDLGRLALPDEVGAAVASALGAPARPGWDADRVLASAVEGLGRASGRILLLDSAETAAGAVEALLAALPAGGAKILVTSRVRLDAPRTLAVDPLREEDALELLERRLGRPLAEDELARARDALRRIDRLPLGIEIVAARARLVGVQGVADRLGAGLGAADGRGRTLGAVIRDSVDRLSERARTLLVRASLARGPLDGALEVLCGTSTPELFEAFEELVASSILRPREPVPDPVRDVAEAWAGPDDVAAWTAWAATFARAASRVSFEDGAPERERLEAHVPDLTAAAMVAPAETAARILLDGEPVLLGRAPLLPYRSALDRVIAQDLPPEADARLRLARAEVLRVSGDPRAAFAEIDRAVASVEGTWLGVALARRSAVRVVLGEPEAALVDAEAAVERLEADGPLDRDERLRWLGVAWTTRASALAMLERTEEAEAALRAATSALGEAKAVRNLAIAELNLGVILLRAGRMPDARFRLERALEAARRVGDRRHTGLALGNLGAVDLELGRVDEAALRTREAMEALEAAGDLNSRLGFAANLAAVAMEREDFDHACSVLEEVRSTSVRGRTLPVAVVASRWLGLAHLLAGRRAEARAAFRENLALARAAADAKGIELASRWLAILDALDCGEPPPAPLASGRFEERLALRTRPS